MPPSTASFAGYRCFSLGHRQLLGVGLCPWGLAVPAVIFTVWREGDDKAHPRRLCFWSPTEVLVGTGTLARHPLLHSERLPVIWDLFLNENLEGWDA